MELHREEQLPPQEPWGRLLRLGAEEDEPQILLWKRQWTIGRKRGCDLSFPSNKLVSGDHCKLIVDEKSGHVILEDTSTNGTVINKMRLVKKQAYPLQSGDIIYLVYRKNEPEHTVAYLYESLKEKQSLTQEFFEANKGNMFHVTKDSSGRRQRDDRQVLPLSPMAQSCLEEPQPSTSTSDLFPLASTSSSEPELSSAGQKHSSGSDGELDLDLQLLVADQRGNAQTSQESGRVASVKPDKMGETLTCIICQDLLHDCVSLQPCMHTFCAACYSGWMYRSSLCPTCRCPVERICKNHILNNLVEAYLIQHPDKSRSKEDVKNMDAKNKITQDMLQPKVRRSFSDEEGSSEDLLELSDVDSESSDISQPYIVYRQCPEYRRQAVQSLPCPIPSSELGVTQALCGEAPSTSASLPAAAQEYMCPLQGSHAICTCCFQPMPDRRAEREQGSRVAPQQCAVCLQPFCHLYWGCTRTGCFGCLAPFCELNLGDKCLDGVLNNNNCESDILKVSPPHLFWGIQ
nr:E3 ubiquitin-protein ligase CHFR-like isoform X1 [Meriones unguiculatus]